ncbi:MAG: VWA domain-containing protein [Pyrinomonadaceae bacterium]
MFCFFIWTSLSVFVFAQSNDDEVVKIDTSIVINDVQVLDKKGKDVKGLKKKNFVITEDNVPQEIESFALGDDAAIPRSIVLIMDYSGSQKSYIDTSVEAAKTLVDKLNPRDRIAVLTDDVRMLSSFTSDKELLKKRLDTLKTLSSTKKFGASQQYSALHAALSKLFGDEDVRPIVIFQTDGDEIYWLPKRGFTFEDILKAAEKARVTIYSIIPGPKFIGVNKKEQQRLAENEIQNSQTDRSAAGNSGVINSSYTIPENVVKSYVKAMLKQHAALSKVAESSGGFVDYLISPNQAGVVYSRILQGINNRYVLGYYPTNQARDGTRRMVKVEVRGHPEYTVIGRKTYYAPESGK